MAIQPLTAIPDSTDVFIDTNILVYGLSNKSAECRAFLERCAKEEVSGFSMFEIVNEACHSFMLIEAYEIKEIPTAKSTASLRAKAETLIPRLAKYWAYTQTILRLNLGFIPTEEAIIRTAQSERQAAGLLTTDSMIVSGMRHYGLSLIATNDADFHRVSGITVFAPSDLP